MLALIKDIPVELLLRCIQFLPWQKIQSLRLVSLELLQLVALLCSTRKVQGFNKTFYPPLLDHQIPLQLCSKFGINPEDCKLSFTSNIHISEVRQYIASGIPLHIVIKKNDYFYNILKELPKNVSFELDFMPFYPIKCDFIIGLSIVFNCKNVDFIKYCPNLKNLTLLGYYSDDTLTPLANALNAMTKLETITLSVGKITEELLPYINTKIKSLDLRDYLGSTQRLLIFINSLQCLKSLKLPDGILQDPMLYGNNVEYVDLSNNPITTSDDIGIPNLMKWLSNLTHLTFINLNGCGIGLMALKDLQNLPISILTLILSNNPINGIPCAIIISNIVKKLTNLTFIELNNCDLDINDLKILIPVFTKNESHFCT
jgi:hypothetical protein